MYIDRIEVSFDAGHRLLAYHGKCAAPHGHTYRAEIFVSARQLNVLGLLVDFGDVKAPIRSWIDRHWDHGFLLNDEDCMLIDALRAIPESKLYLFRGINPSAEAIARELFEQSCRLVGSIVSGVRIWETPSTYAEYSRDEVHSLWAVGEFAQ